MAAADAACRPVVTPLLQVSSRPGLPHWHLVSLCALCCAGSLTWQADMAVAHTDSFPCTYGSMATSSQHLNLTRLLNQLPYPVLLPMLRCSPGWPWLCLSMPPQGLWLMPACPHQQQLCHPPQLPLIQLQGSWHQHRRPVMHSLKGRALHAQPQQQRHLLLVTELTWPSPKDADAHNALLLQSLPSSCRFGRAVRTSWQPSTGPWDASSAHAVRIFFIRAGTVLGVQSALLCKLLAGISLPCKLRTAQRLSPDTMPCLPAHQQGLQRLLGVLPSCILPPDRGSVQQHPCSNAVCLVQSTRAGQSLTARTRRS